MLLLSALVSLATLSTRAVAAATVNTRIQWVDCANNVPVPIQQAYNLTGQSWKGSHLPVLPKTLKCGRINVPMDYEKPISANNTISIGFAMYRPNGAKELLNFNPGGPGVEVASYAWNIALNNTVPSYFAGLLNQDFLGMDVRGTHQSTPINCSQELVRALPVAIPKNSSAFEHYQTLIRGVAESCVELSSPAGILGHLGTQEVVQDWNTLRAALGYEKMNYIGVSYGTYGGSELVARFPERVNHVVLDAITPHGIPTRDAAVNQITAINRLLLRADAYCMYDSACPFHSQGKGAVPSAFASVVELVQNGTFPGLTPAEAKFMLYYYLNATPDFPLFNVVLAQALAGDGTLLKPIPDIMSAIAAALPIFCVDEDVSEGWDEFEQVIDEVAKVDNASFGYAQSWQIKTMCSAWPIRGRERKDLKINSPILFLTSDYDLNTPTEWATRQWENAPNSSLVVRHGDGHGTFDLPGQPAWILETAFSKNGKQPAPTESRLVSVYGPGSQRPPIADPYQGPIGPDAGDHSSIE